MRQAGNTEGTDSNDPSRTRFELVRTFVAVMS